MRTDGYGTAWRNGKNVRAHRLVYEECFGYAAADHDVHHECGNKACVNPEHLRALPHGRHVRLHDTAVNARAAMLANSAARTHCPRGHEWSLANTVYWSGSRRCRACNRERGRITSEQKRARVVVA